MSSNVVQLDNKKKKLLSNDILAISITPNFENSKISNFFTALLKMHSIF